MRREDGWELVRPDGWEGPDLQQQRERAGRVPAERGAGGRSAGLARRRPNLGAEHLQRQLDILPEGQRVSPSSGGRSVGQLSRRPRVCACVCVYVCAYTRACVHATGGGGDLLPGVRLRDERARAEADARAGPSEQQLGWPTGRRVGRALHHPVLVEAVRRELQPVRQRPAASDRPRPAGEEPRSIGAGPGHRHAHHRVG